jgi:hypothetical protein
LNNQDVYEVFLDSCCNGLAFGEDFMAGGPAAIKTKQRWKHTGEWEKGKPHSWASFWQSKFEATKARLPADQRTPQNVIKALRDEWQSMPADMKAMYDRAVQVREV